MALDERAECRLWIRPDGQPLELIGTDRQPRCWYPRTCPYPGCEAVLGRRLCERESEL